MLLHGLGRLNQLADKSQELCAQRRIFLDVDAFVGQVELGEEWKEDLNATDGVECAVDGMCNHSFDVLLKNERLKFFLLQNHL